MMIINERRLDGRVRLLQFAAMLCALFAATGILVGIHDANPAAGWVVPALAGIVGAVAFAAYWHWAIGSLVAVANPFRITARFLLSVAVTAIAVLASAQGIAQGVAGHAALVRELENRIEGYSKALDDAFVKGTAWSPLASAAFTKEAGFIKLAELEQAGEHNTGKGCGPLCSFDKQVADSLQEAAAEGDQKAFMIGGNEVNRAITDLNGIDPRAIIDVTGAVRVNQGPNGVVQMEDDGPTKDFEAMANKLLAERQFVAPQTFTPISLGEATRSPDVRLGGPRLDSGQCH
jgi:hypothetical protein